VKPSAVAVPEGYRRPLHLALTARASEGYRAAGRFAHGFARGKLGRDPLFIDMLRHGVFPSEGRFLDLGCGQAVFAAWLLAAQEMADAGQWPAGWPPPPRVINLLGLELMPSDVARAHAALARFAPRVTIRQGDVTREEFAPCEVVTILDVLHYFDHDRQRDVLTRVHRALTAGAPGGVLVARVGDAAAGWRFELSRKVDQVVTFVRGHGWSDLYCRPVGEWRALLQEIGFDVQVFASEGGPPFANTFLIARPRNHRGPGEE
jgi:SAM-dependent methyltransferase